MGSWLEYLFQNGGIATGIIAGIVAALVQFLIAHLDHVFITRTKKEQQTHEFLEWQRNEIEKLISEISAIRVPAITEANEEIIETAYHLIRAAFERATLLLYREGGPITIKGFFNTLDRRYRQMHAIKLGYEKELKLEDSKIVLIEEIEECKHRLLTVLQKKEMKLCPK